MKDPIRSLATVAAVAGRYALAAGCGAHLTLSDGSENGGMPFVRLDFEDVESDSPLEFDLLTDDQEAFRGLVELTIFKYRNPGTAP